MTAPELISCLLLGSMYSLDQLPQVVMEAVVDVRAAVGMAQTPSGMSLRVHVHA